MNLHEGYSEARDKYLKSLPTELKSLESSLRNVDQKQKKDIGKDLLGLIQQVQSIKGVSGSYELSFIANACHNLSDHLETISDMKDDDVVIVDFLLILLGLVSDYTQDLIEEIQTESSYKGRFNDLINTDKKKKHRVLIVEKEQHLLENIKKILKKLDVDYSIVHSGQDAFFRLLNEKFDSLITGVNTGTIDGISLVALTKVVSSPNLGIKSILMASETYSILPLHSMPYRIIYRDENLLDGLELIYDRILAGEKDNLVQLTHPSSDEWRILCLDDDKEVHNLLELSFSKSKDVNFLNCFDSKEMFSKIEEFRPHLILLDVMLTNESGVDVLANIRKSESFSDMPVIFLTSRSQDLQGQQLVNTDAMGILSKPFSPKNILTEIQSLYLMFYPKSPKLTK